MRIQYQIKEIERILEKHDARVDARVDQAVSSQVSASVPKSSGLKLPKLDLPQISGKYKYWITFIDQFKSAIDMNEAIPEIQKLNYLNACLKDEAAAVVAHLPLTASNYEIGLKLLEEQYSNKRLILKAHLDAILQAPSLRCESAEGLPACK